VRDEVGGLDARRDADVALLHVQEQVFDLLGLRLRLGLVLRDLAEREGVALAVVTKKDSAAVVARLDGGHRVLLEEQRQADITAATVPNQIGQGKAKRTHGESP
jgi:hypothetical protein